MLIDGMELVEGSTITNLGVPTGSVFPGLANKGELFYRDDQDSLYIYSVIAADWVAIAKGADAASKWLIDTADRIYRVGDTGLGATAPAGKKFYVLGDVQFDGALVMGNNPVSVTASPTLPDHLVNKAYVDGLAGTVLWDDPIRHTNLINDSLSTPPGSPAFSDVYVVSGTGTGAWTGLDGKLVQWNGSAWVDQGVLASGMRFGIAIDSVTVPAGSFAGQKNSIATYNGATFDIAAPVDKRAMFVNNAGSLHAWHQYVYQIATTEWIEFGGPNTIVDGDNLSFFGNQLNVVGGAGSGLDGDTLDGSHLSDLDAKYVDVAGDTIAGDMVMTGGVDASKFVMPAIDQILTSTAVVDSVIYDTTLDSDGGQWRFLKKSWSSEAVPSGKYLGRVADESAARSDGGVAGDWYQSSAASTFFELSGASGTTQIYRAGRSEFPKIAVVVAESNRVVIYDLTTAAPTMWKAISRIGWAADNSVALWGVPSSVDALAGVISIGHADGVALYDWPADRSSIQRADSNTAGVFESSLADVNTPSNYLGNSAALIHSNVNGVAMTVLPDAPINSVTGLKVPTIAVATNGGVSVITDSGAVYDITHSASGVVALVGFNSDNNIYYATDATLNTQRYTHIKSIPTSDVSEGNAFNKGSSLAFYSAGTYTGGNIDVRLGNSDSTKLSGVCESNGVLQFGVSLGDATKRGLWSLLANSNTPANALLAYSTTDYATAWLPGDIRTCLLADSNVGNIVGTELIVNGTFDSDVSGWAGIAALTWNSGQIDIVRGGGTSVDSCYQDMATVIGELYVVSLDAIAMSVGLQVAIDGVVVIDTSTPLLGVLTASFLPTSNVTRIDIRPAYDLFGTLTIDNISCRLAVEDRSVKGNGAQVFGTLTKSLITPDSDLVAYSNFTASNYIKQPYNADLDFGTADFWYSMWLKMDSTSSTKFIISRGSYNGAWSGGAFYLRMLSNGTLSFVITDDGYSTNDQITSTRSANDGQWHFVEAVREGNQINIYIDGVAESPVTIVSALGSLSNTNADMVVSNAHDYTVPFSNGAIALFRSSATVPTAGQRKHMYETERQMIKGKALLGGTSSAITALDFDDSRNELSAGTSIGKSVFNNLTRVNYQADANITSLSSYQDIEFVGNSSGSDIKIPEIDLKPLLSQTTIKSSDDSWTDLVLLNNWVQQAGYQTAQYRKVGDVVEVRGQIQSGTTTNSTTIFELPVGYRPAQTQLISVMASGNDVGYVDITTAGAVQITSITNNAWLSLAGIKFSIS